VQVDRADIAWAPSLGLIVAAAGDTGSLVVRHLAATGDWSDLGAPLGDATPCALLLDVALSHGPEDSAPLVLYSINHGGAAIKEAVALRFAAGTWPPVGAALPRTGRQQSPADPRAVAIADAARPLAVLVLAGVLPGAAVGRDDTLALYRFE
jgi:hypothetical protein